MTFDQLLCHSPNPPAPAPYNPSATSDFTTTSDFTPPTCSIPFPDPPPPRKKHAVSRLHRYSNEYHTRNTTTEFPAQPATAPYTRPIRPTHVPTSLRGPGHAGSSIGSAPPSPSGFLRQKVQRCRSVTGSVRRRSTSSSFSRWMSACVVSADGRAAPAAVVPPPAPAAVGGGAPGAGVDGAVAAAVPDADFLVEPPLPALLLDLALVADCCSW